MKKRRTRISFITLVFLLSLPVHIWAWSGEVVSITDGDTITVLNSKAQKNVKIWLYGIDTPEKGQAFGKKAKQFTSKMVFGKAVEVHRMDTDRYGRTVALVSVDKQLLNKELVKAGLAWVYDRYCSEPICESWRNFQLRARMDKRGLWADPDRIPPWEYRRKRRK